MASWDMDVDNPVLAKDDGPVDRLIGGCHGSVYCETCGGVCSQDLGAEALRGSPSVAWPPSGIVTVGSSSGAGPAAAQFCNLDGAPCLRCGGTVRHMALDETPLPDHPIF